MAVAAVAGRAWAKRIRQSSEQSNPVAAWLRTPDDQDEPQRREPADAPAALNDKPAVSGQDRPESPPAASTHSGASDELDTATEHHHGASANGERRAVHSTQRTRRPPIARGGRPRAPNRAESPRLPTNTRFPSSSGPRAHLCVWQQGMGWQLGVEVQPNPYEDLSVRQGSVELERDEYDPDRWHLADRLGVIEIADDAACVARIGDLARGPAHLLFRLVGADLENGILVRQPSAGAYLLLVPHDWDLLESESSDVVVNAGPVTPPTFCAYYVDVEPSSAATVRAGADTTSASAIRFNDAGGRFSLTGTEIEDAAPRHANRSARQGALFGRSAPTILDTHGWGGVSTIIIGEEGSGKKRWREAIDRRTHNPSKRLNELLTERSAGWFFLRFYDEQDDLIDSVDFRFAAGLKAKPCVIDAGEAAGERAFDEVLIEHDPSICVEAAHPDEENLSSSLAADGGSRLRIPRSRDYDSTEWVVRDGDTHVPLHVEVPRFWWRLRNDEASDVRQWTSDVLDLRTNDFRASSPWVLDVSMPASARDSRQALIGFDSSNARPCGSSRSGEFGFPLRELESSAALQNAGRRVLRLYLPSGEAIDLGALKLRARCAYCEAEAPADATEQVKHLYDSHFDNVFHELDYNETARLYPELKFPKAIYDCLHCEQFVPAGPGDPNPTTAIIRHCDENHNGRRRFRPMRRSDEVRQHVIRTLPHAYQCKICRVSLKTEADSVAQLMKNHISHHLNRLITLG